MIEEKLVRVHWSKAIPELGLRLNGYRSKWKRVYIGVTTAPEKRWKNHYRNGYTKMVLLYEAYTEHIAIELERALIEYAHSCNFILPVDNTTPGGEGISEHENYHYLYFIVGDRRE